ncbi:Lrp/AsnC family transcriptional regulator [Aliishimia ponticola]|uniref:Lrp/AsnC family transcriptional regulator n=1 Tax=Aliishimia ponticola TaxID=2499833 RepID=A0A4S4ND65_9RHOB|nr:Lrp/AsnC family transcriptional regulator [Aliishimia ponticola]THH37412.1 Lrp/AsnC family transcriptional regulator [Aliishimia ponticola]
MLDDLDRRILRQWQAEPSLTVPEIAERAGLSAAQVSRRIARIQDTGVIEAVETVIDWAALGYEVEVSLRVTLDKTVARAFDEFIAEARKVPEVLEIQTFLGRVDVRLSLIARDMPDYQRVYRDRILTLPHIADIEALMQVARIKTQEGLPI